MQQADLQARLAALIEEHGVPGAALGVLHDGEVTAVAAGVLNRRTGVEATPDSVFQVGSQTKTWTTVLLMQLVDEGLVDLDVPVRTYLPEFRVADADVSATVTLRHLLSHTSGIDGDHFEDVGRGDDCLARYVESCAELRQTHPLGATMSYCNTGFSIAGRVIEVITGKGWDAVMRERLFQPLGLTHTSTLPEEAIMQRAAVGHVKPTPGAEPDLAPVWMLPRACGPMGLINANVGDVLTFAQLLLAGGRTADGRQLVSSAAIEAMRTPQVESPDRHTLGGSHWGLGLILFGWQGGAVFGHDGGTIGQASMLRILPDSGTALTLLVNGGDVEPVYRTLFGELADDLAGVTMPPSLAAPATPPAVDLARYAGTYERLSLRYEFAVDGDRLVGTATTTGPIAELVPNPVSKIELIPVEEAASATTFLVRDEDSEVPTAGVFYDAGDDGIPRYFHRGARATPRVG